MADVQGAYLAVDVTKLRAVVVMPRHSSSGSSDFSARLINSVRKVLKGSMHQADPALTDVFAATDWVCAWQKKIPNA